MGAQYIEMNNNRSTANISVSDKDNVVKMELYETCAADFEKNIDDSSLTTIDKEAAKNSIISYFNAIETSTSNIPLVNKLDFLYSLYSKLDTPAFFKACSKRETILNTIKEQLSELTKFTPENKKQSKTEKSSYFEMQLNTYDLSHTNIDEHIKDHKEFTPVIKEQYNSHFFAAKNKDDFTQNGLYQSHYSDFYNYTLPMNNYTDSNINKLPTALKLITDAKLTGKDDKQYINRNGELTSLAKSTLKNKLILQEIEKDIKKSPEEYLQKSEDSHKKLSTNALATHIIRQHILPEQFTRILPAEQNKRILDLLEDIQKDLGIDGNAVIANIKVDDGTNKYHKFINELKILSISTSITTWDMLMNSFTPVKVEADSDGDIYEECIEIHATNIYLAYMTSGNHWLDSIDIVLLDNYFRSAKTQEQNMPLELETMLSNNLVNTYINKSNHWTPDTITNKEIPTVASDGNCGITSVLFVYSELENKVVAS